MTCTTTYMAASRSSRAALQVPFEVLQVDARNEEVSRVPARAGGIQVEGYSGRQLQLRATASDDSADCPSMLPITTLESLARAAALPEIADLDFRAVNAQEMTEPETVAWRRVQKFAALVAIAAVAAAIDTHSSTRTPGAGPADAP